MSKKCIGCGAEMQSENHDLEGYISLDKYDISSICERCFRIKNYGDYKSIIKDNDSFVSILKNIDKKSLVLLVMDLFNLPEDISIISENIKNPVLIVLTKRDVLPKRVFNQKLLDYIEKYNLNYVDKIIVSSDKNYNFDNLIGKIRKYNTNNKIYIVGFTNAGKSTLINKLIHNYSDKKPSITTSMLPSTTLNSIEIKFNDDMVFIDTPGFLNSGSVDNYVNLSTLKRINPSREIRPITYQIKSNQTIVIEDICSVNLSSNDITIFMSNTLKVDRFYKEKELDNLEYQEVFVRGGEDLVINGLGFIKFTKNEKVKVGIIKGTKVYTRKSLV